MKYSIAVIFFLFVGCQPGCKRDEAKKVMGDWFLRKIALPENMPLVNAETVKEDLLFKLGEKRPKRFVIHYVLADCDKCVHELMEIQEYLDRNREEYRDVGFVFIATGPVDTYVKEASDSIRFPYPVYFDGKYQSFKILNNLPLSEKLYNTMLLDDQDRLLVFGAFYSNTKAENLYRGLLDCEIN